MKKPISLLIHCGIFLLSLPFALHPVVGQEKAPVPGARQQSGATDAVKVRF
jgi:hypothetical protein